MKYDLKQDNDKGKFILRVKQVIESGKFVELKEIKPLRSNQQNRYLHLILSYFAYEYGETLEFIKQEYFKKLVSPDIFIYERVNTVTGEVRQAIKSTAELKTDELTTAIERFRDWSALEFGLYLPEPNETEHINHIQKTVN